MQKILNLSGGKDSTAMLLLMIEQGERIDRIIHIDEGVVFPELKRHIHQLQEYIEPLKIETYGLGFEYYLGHFRVKTRQNRWKTGYGWPRWTSRWCTGRKIDLIEYMANYQDGRRKRCYHKNYPEDCLHIIGIAADERRHLSKYKRYPLVEWGITQKDALKICYERGFLFGGLYEHMDRAGCFCCPFAPYRTLQYIYVERPELWAEIRRLDALSSISFRRGMSLNTLELYFASGEPPRRLDKYRFSV